MFRKSLVMCLILAALLATTGSVMVSDDPPPPEDTEAPPEEAPPEEAPPEEAPPRTVLEILEADEQFTRLVELLKITQADEALQANGSFTVFAPNNEVFDTMAEVQRRAALRPWVALHPLHWFRLLAQHLSQL